LRAKARRTLVQEWLQLQRRDAPIRRNTELSVLTGRFSFAVNFCHTQLQANPCWEVEQLPKNVARGPPRRAGRPERQMPCAHKFKNRQTACYVDVIHGIGMRLAGMGKSSR
jgi:hypothetical protein